MVWFVFYTLVKLDILTAGFSFHNSETEAKLNKARHPFSKEVIWNLPADFQPIPLEDARKRTKNVRPCMQFYFIEKKKNEKPLYKIGMVRC